MNKIALTDPRLKNLHPTPTRRTIWDSIVPGLAVTVGAKGIPSFYVVKRQAGTKSPKWILLGTYPTLPLKDARDRARDTLRVLAEGENPTALAEAKRQARHDSAFAIVAENFIARHLPQLRTGRTVEALIRRELIPTLGNTPIAEIRRGDITTLLETIIDRQRLDPRSGGPNAARKTLAALSKLFNWTLSLGQHDLDTNPCNQIKPADLALGVKVRDRILTDPELRLVWQVADSTPYPFGTLVKALLLTGQRLNEIAAARRSEIAGTILTVPAARMKGKVAHTVPLTGDATALLETAFDATPLEPRFIFSTTGGLRPVSGFSKFKSHFDRALTTLNGGTPLPRWTLHDLRRTARTGMAAAGVNVFIAELVIGHRQTGVHAVYDLHRYDSEKRKALEVWNARLAAILSPPPDNLVRLRN